MSDTVQLMTVRVVVAAAVGFVLRRVWRKHKGQGPACGQCEACRGKAR